jgi:WD40 repeat protein
VKYKEIKYEKSIKAKKGTIYSITKINNDEIAVACGNEILIIDINKKTNESEFLFNEYPSLIGHTKNVLCLSLLSENKLVSGSEDKSPKIWDITDKKCINTISSDFQRIDSILPLQDNIIILGTHNIIKIINIETKEEISSLIGHQKSICSIIRINNVLIASSSYDNSINIYNIQTNEFKFSLLGHDSPVFCILLLRDGRLISGSGSWNKSLKIWNLDKRKCECTLIGHKREVRDIKQLNNGWIITASNDKTIKVWDIHKKICIQTLISHYDIIFSLCIIDKNKFVSGGRDQDIIIWKC